MDEILKAVGLLRIALDRHDIDGPQVILLETPEAGRKLMHLVSQTDIITVRFPSQAYRPVEHPDGSTWIEYNLMGTLFRWPATKRALTGGSFVWAP